MSQSFVPFITKPALLQAARIIQKIESQDPKKGKKPVMAAFRRLAQQYSEEDVMKWVSESGLKFMNNAQQAAVENEQPSKQQEIVSLDYAGVGFSVLCALCLLDSTKELLYHTNTQAETLHRCFVKADNDERNAPDSPLNLIEDAKLVDEFKGDRQSTLLFKQYKLLYVFGAKAAPQATPDESAAVNAAAVALRAAITGNTPTRIDVLRVGLHQPFDFASDIKAKRDANDEQRFTYIPPQGLEEEYEHYRNWTAIEKQTRVRTQIVDRIHALTNGPIIEVKAFSNDGQLLRQIADHIPRDPSTYIDNMIADGYALLKSHPALLDYPNRVWAYCGQSLDEDIDFGHVWNRSRAILAHAIEHNYVLPTHNDEDGEEWQTNVKPKKNKKPKPKGGFAPRSPKAQRGPNTPTSPKGQSSPPKGRGNWRN